MLSPSLVILIPQSREKNPRSSLKVNSAKHPGSFSYFVGPKEIAEILLPPLRDQDDRRFIFSYVLRHYRVAFVMGRNLRTFGCGGWI
jgi:hypothetical protein